jgi:hypothetical protein
VEDEAPEREMGVEAVLSVTCLLDVPGKLAWVYVDYAMLYWKMGQLVVGRWVPGLVTMEGGHRRRNRD